MLVIPLAMKTPVALLLTFFIAAALLADRSAPAAAAEPRIVLGEPETVLADGQLGLRYFPDERLALVRTRPTCRVLIAANVSSFLLEGPTLGKFTSAKQVLDKGKPGEFDNGYAGISAAWRAPSGELLAVYHAEDQEEMTRSKDSIPGFYCRVALAVSRDDGATFDKGGPILSGQLAKVAGGRFDQGVGEPWVTAEPGGKWLCGYYTSHEPIDGRGVTICTARCPVADALKPVAWRKFFQGDFTEPGLGGRDTPVVTSGRAQTSTMFPHVFHLATLRQFLMLFCMNAWREGDRPEHSGIYAAFSADGIHWPHERMRQIWKVPVIPAIGRMLAWHPTFIPDDAAGNDTRGWLYYGYSESWGHKPPHKPHYLMRRPMTITF